MQKYQKMKINFAKLVYFFGAISISALCLWIIGILVLDYNELYKSPPKFFIPLFASSLIISGLSSLGIIVSSFLYFKFQKKINPSRTGWIIILLIYGSLVFLFNLAGFLASVFFET